MTANTTEITLFRVLYFIIVSSSKLDTRYSFQIIPNSIVPFFNWNFRLAARLINIILIHFPVVF